MKTEWRIFLTFWIIYSLFAGYINWNENSRLDLTMAIVDEGRFQIDSYANNTGDRAVRDGHYYSDKAPGMSLLAVPVYSIYKLAAGKPDVPDNLYGLDVSRDYLILVFLCIIFTSGAFGALSVVLVYKASQFYTKDKSRLWMIVLGYGLGTIIFTYSRLFFGHVASATLAFLSFYLILKYRFEKKDLFFLSGLSAGAAVLVEYPALLVLILNIAFIIFTFPKKSSVLKFLAGASVFLFILGLYQYACFGSVFTTGYNNQFRDTGIWDGAGGMQLDSRGIDQAMQSRSYILKDPSLCSMIRNSHMQRGCIRVHAMQTGNISLCEDIPGVPAHLPLCLALAASDSEACGSVPDYIDQAMCRYTITGEHTLVSRLRELQISMWPRLSLRVPAMLLLSPSGGLLLFSPVLFFSLIGLFMMFRKHGPEKVYILMLFILLLAYNSGIPVWWGGSAFGARHLILAVPFLMIPLAATWLRNWILYSAVSLSFILTTVSIQEQPALFPSIAISGPQAHLLEQIALGRMHFMPYTALLTAGVVAGLIWSRRIRVLYRKRAVLLSLLFLIMLSTAYSVVRAKNTFPGEVNLNGRGWYPEEADCTWMAEESSIEINRAGTLLLTAPIVIEPMAVSIYIESSLIGIFNITEGWQYQIPVRPGALKLSADHCIIPPGDGRCLSICVGAELT